MSLDAIRQEIDRIDDAILRLLGERVAATARVRAQKSGDGSLAVSPIRPAREAAILRRLIAQRGTGLSPDLLVRLWRGILVSSTLSQAPVVLHVAADGLGARLTLRDHFGPMPVKEHADGASALAALGANGSDIAALDAGSAALLALPDSVSVIATLPVLKAGGAPDLLVLGHAQAQPSGDDHTLVVGEPSRDPLWQTGTAATRLFALPGFLTDEEVSKFAAPGYRIAGRCPAPIEV